MVRRCSDKLAKLLLVVFNALFLICGIALLVLAAYDFRNVRSVGAIISGLNNVNIATLVVGLAIAIISFLGCCGALKENSCMLNAFVGILVIILIAEIAVGYFAFVNRQQVEDLIKKEALNSLDKTKEKGLVKDAWDDIQSSYKCCGVNDYNDYLQKSLPIPDTCCKNKLPDGQQCGPNVDGFQTRGCFVEMDKLLRHQTLYIGIAAVVVAFIELAGIIFACCLRGAIKENYETV